MTDYTIARKLPSMDSYTVADASGTELYTAKHHLGLGKEHWDIADHSGAVVATLLHERAHLHATYKISGDDLADATFTKTNYLTMAETWTLDTEAGQVRLEGDLVDHRWTLTSADGSVTATLVRRMVSLHHQFLVTVDGDPRVTIALAIALDVEQDEHK